MKKIYILASIIMAATTAMAQEEEPVLTTLQAEIPYINHFDETAEQADVAFYDANNDGAKISIYQNGLRYAYSSSNDANDYAIFPGLKVTAGKTYRMSIDVRAHNKSYAEKFEVLMGNEAKVSAFTETLVEATETKSTDFITYTAEFTATADGFKYIAWHAISTKYRYYIYADNFKVVTVNPDGTTDEPADLGPNLNTNTAVLPYLNTFETSAEQSLVGIYDGNSDSKTFQWYRPSGGTNTTYAARCNYNTKMNNDDYLTMPGLPMEAGKKYVISYDTRGYNENYTETYEVLWAMDDAHLTSFTNTLVEPTDVATGTYKGNALIFEPEKDGVYYFSFHCISEMGKSWYLYIDNFSVKEPGEVVINDKEDYSNKPTDIVEKLTYNRTFGTTYWQPLYVPFASKRGDWGDNVEIAQLTAASSDALTIDMLDDDATIEANTPYFIRAIETGDIAVVVENTTIDSKLPSYTTTIQGIKFTGTYLEKTIYAHTSYSTNYILHEGAIVANSNTYYLPPMRWHISGGLTVAQGAKIVVMDDITGIKTAATSSNEVESVYSIGGVRQQQLNKGVNIVRMSDGKVKTIMVK